MKAKSARAREAGPRAMRASERVTGRLPAEALRTEPALVIAHDLAAVGAVFQVVRDRRLWHSPGVARKLFRYLRVLEVDGEIRLCAGNELPSRECDVSKLKCSRPFAAA